VRPLTRFLVGLALALATLAAPVQAQEIDLLDDDEEDLDVPGLDEVLAVPDEPCPDGLVRAPNNACIRQVDPQVVESLSAYRRRALRLCEIRYHQAHTGRDLLVFYLYPEARKAPASTWVVGDTQGRWLTPAAARTLLEAESSQAGAVFDEHGTPVLLTDAQSGDALAALASAVAFGLAGTSIAYLATHAVSTPKGLREVGIGAEPRGTVAVSAWVEQYNTTLLDELGLLTERFTSGSVHLPGDCPELLR